MEYIELDGSNRQGCTSTEIHHKEKYRDWFSTGDKLAEAEDNSTTDLMEISPPTSNPNDYDYDHQKQQQQQHYDQQKTLDLGIGGQICNIEKEQMFDKVVTPSDVGKLNRLVIPKQHAEKYFPLDSSSNDQKGLLLNFEDVTGKTWRFRYSYWSSSQSYVMTKGWSRFVKDKKLDAGDVVSFQRGVGEAEKHRLFIDWRRRPIDAYHTQFYRSVGGGNLHSWNPLVFRPPPTCSLVHPSINFQIPNQSSHYYSGYGGGNNYMGHHQVVTENGSVMYLTSPEINGMLQAGRRGGGFGDRPIPMVFESFPLVHGKKVVADQAASAKKLRLFGVNMECPISSDTSTSDECEILSSSSAIQPVNSSQTSYLNQYPSSSTMLIPSSTRMRMYNSSTPAVSNKGKTSMSLDFEI